MTQAERYLILAKHALPEIVTELPARDWRLNDEGRQRAIALGQRLKAFNPARIVSSDEPKAIETATIAAAEIGLPPESAPGLQEHERRRVGFLSTQRFVEGVKDLFMYPDKLVFGDETADQSYRRFAGAVDALLAATPTGNLVVVAHGTVISLFASRRAGMDGFSLWQGLDMPSFVVFALPGFRFTSAARTVVA
jgi:broad specificity phosphatase PhoE